MTTQLPYIQKLLEDPAVDRVIIDGWKHVYVEKNDRLEDVPTPFHTEDELYGLVQAFAKILGVQVDEMNPLISLRLPDGTRADIALPPISIIGPAITIMKVRPQKIQLEDMFKYNVFTQAAADFLKACIESRINIAISGGTSSGKTTLMKVMANWIPLDERIIFLQQVMSEAKLPHQRLVSLETRPPNIEGKGAITMLDLIQCALRMRPDRIIVEELIGAETSELVNAMNRGHDGCMFTISSNGPRDTLSRLERFVAMATPEMPLPAIREQICSAIDLIVHIEQMRDGSRKIVWISEVQNMDKGVIVLEDIFLFEQTGFENGAIQGSLRPTGIIPRFLDKLNSAGIQLPLSMFTPENG